MFQSIKYLNYTYNNKTKLYTYNYELVDSEFTSTPAAAGRVSAVEPSSSAACGRAGAGSAAASAIKEYENRKTNHQEIIKNLFLLNIFLLKQNWGYKDMNQILEYQHKYLIKKYYPETNFNEKYYDDLVKYTKKMAIIF